MENKDKPKIGILSGNTKKIIKHNYESAEEMMIKSKKPVVPMDVFDFCGYKKK